MSIIHDNIQFFINHVIYPFRLPQKAITSDNEGLLFELICKIIDDIEKYKGYAKISEKFKEIKTIFDTWYNLQCSVKLSKKQIHEEINKLQNNESIALYLANQNSTIMIYMNDEPIITAFQCSASNSDIMTTNGDLIGSFPQRAIRTNDKSMVKSLTFASVIENLSNTLTDDASAKTYKQGTHHTEERDVANPVLVFDWLLPTLGAHNAVVFEDYQNIINKKIRDDVLHSNTLLPFRRSPLWMAIKVVLQTRLYQLFGSTTGLALYKIMLLLALNEICFHSKNLQVEIKSQIIKKLALRMDKLNELTIDQSLKSLYDECIRNVTRTIESTQKSMQLTFNKTILASRSQSAELNHSLISRNDCKHNFSDLKSKIVKFCKLFDQNECQDVEQPKCEKRNYLDCEFPNLEVLKVTHQSKLLVALFDIETWIKNIDLNSITLKDDYSTKKLFNLHDQYLEKAINFYKNDEIGYSRMTLTSIKIVCVLDKLAMLEFPLLKEHDFGFDVSIFEDMLVERSSDMYELNKLKEYIINRNKKSSLPSLLSANLTKKSFGVRFYDSETDESNEMHKLKLHIEKIATTKQKTKQEEILRGRQFYLDLQAKIEKMDCEYRYSKWGNPYHYRHCSKCNLYTRAENIRIQIYEWPLPENETEAKQVIFELLIPSCISYLRDSLHLLKAKVLSEESKKSSDIRCTWIDYFELKDYSLKIQKYVSYGSINKRFSEMHYKEKHPNNSIDEFLTPNNYSVTLCDCIRDQSISYNSDIKKFKTECTFKTIKPYECLQWTMPTTTHSENEVISKQAQCPRELNLREFVNFGLLRSGHRLQIRNILSAFEIRSLSFDHLSVVYLIQQALWQIGPIENDRGKTLSTHSDLKNPLVVEKFYDVLLEYLKINSKCWSKCLFVLNLINIAGKCISMVKDYETKVKMIELLREIRDNLFDWIDCIKKCLKETNRAEKHAIAQLKDTLFSVCCMIILTYWVDRQYMPLLINTNKDIIQWLTSMSYIKNNCSFVESISSNDKVGLFQRNLLRRVYRCQLEIENIFIEYSSNNDFQALNEFLHVYWPDARNGNFTKWSIYDRPCQHWFYTQFKSNTNNKIVLIQLSIDGSFLVQGKSVGTLPSIIYTHKDYMRFFRSINFDVCPSSKTSNEYVTENINLKSIGCVNYTFSYHDNELLITERCIDSQYIYIPHNFFCNNLPLKLIDDYSHWLNQQTNIIEFRQKVFNDDYDGYVYYKLDLNSHTLRDLISNQDLINVISKTFNEIFEKFIFRLELREYVHIFYKNSLFLINLPRLGLNFLIDENNKKKILSKEYRGMKVSECQKIETLFGLEQGLVLIDDLIEQHDLARKQIIIPNGVVGFNGNETNHQKIEIDTAQLRSPTYYSYYFDTILRKLRAEESISSWHYLALLHASTSHALPDPFTEMTGTEMSLQILQSANCWSCKPFNEESLFILSRISLFSPVREFYPRGMHVMQKIEWPFYLPSICAHDGYWLIVDKLISDSNRMKFQYESLKNENEANDERLTEEKASKYLSCRSYHRIQKYYSYLAKFTRDFEEIICEKSTPKYLFHSEYDWNNSKIDNVRIVASNSHRPSDDFNFEKFFYDKAKWKHNGILTRDFNDSCLVCSLPFWLKISNELVYYSIDLYNISKANLNREESKLFQFILSFIAFKINNIDILLFFQNVKKQKMEFVSIKEPKYDEYNDLFEFNYNGVKVKEILMNNFINFDEYLGKHKKLPDEKESEFVERVKNLFDEVKNNEIDSVEEKFSNEWLSDKSISVPLKYIKKSALLEISAVLKKWNMNRELKEFVVKISNQYENLEIDDEPETLTSVSSDIFDLTYVQRSFKIQISINSDHEIIQEAKQIFSHGKLKYECGFSKEKYVTEEDFSTNKDQKFPFTTENEECGVTNTILNNLKESWNSFMSQKERKISTNIDTKQLKRELLIEKQQILTRTNAIENFLKVMLLNNKITSTLLTVNILPSLIPQVILKYLIHQYDPCFVACDSYKYLVGALSVLWSLRQRIDRLLLDLSKNSLTDSASIIESLSNEPHQNWSPALKPEWLIFEIESNVTIRPIQVNVAENMINPLNNDNCVMQLNMGEGKTSVIVPLVISSLADGENIVQIVVLKSLLNTNYNQLCYKLGGLLNKRVYILPFKRDLSFTTDHLNSIESLIKECQNSKGVLISLPEYQLSFKLKAIELCRTPDERSKKALDIQNYFEKYLRIILDESDEILSVKNQLVYTCGNNELVDGGSLRWSIAYIVLMAAKNHLNDIKSIFGDDSIEIHFNKLYLQAYPYFRILKQDAFEYLCDKICDDILDRKICSHEIRFLPFNSYQKYHLKLYLLSKKVSEETRLVVDTLEDVCSFSKKVMYTLRGYFTYDILFTVLNKRWRVDYGVNFINKNLLQAVPYRAKDIPAERAQFAHPDIIIILTYLSYFYSGLSDKQIECTFNSLQKSTTANEDYTSWINELPSDYKIDKSIEQYSGINLSDLKQKRELLYPTFRMHTLTIHYWLSEYVFRREAKEFTRKLSASCWDLCKTSERPITGFSGTNDSMMILLPLNTKYYQIPQLIGTSGMLLNHLMKKENNIYEHLEPDSLGIDILRIISKYYSNNLRVLLDCGALMIDLSNEQVIKEWLKLVPQAEAGICFDSNNNLIVIDRHKNVSPLEVSPFKLQLDKCVVYLDDSHTRGTDLKFPLDTIGMVTLGRGLTKDRLMQACMRLRKLGNGHSVRFLASHEVHVQILNNNNTKQVTSTHVLEWAINNTRNQSIDDFLYWSIQGLSFFRREALVNKFKSTQNQFEFAEATIENEMNELNRLYGSNRDELRLVDIIENRSNTIAYQIKSDQFLSSSKMIIKKLEALMSNEKRYTNLLDEEQELELEAELEEECEIERPPLSQPCKNQLDNDVKSFIINGCYESKPENIFPLYKAIENTSIESLFQKEAWNHKILVTRDFIQTVDSLDERDLYLKTPRWLCVFENSTILILSSFEANEFYQIFNDKTSTLVTYLPRSSKDTQKLSFSFSQIAIDDDLLAQLNVFSGNLYFIDDKEENAFCKFIGYCPAPRNIDNEILFNNGLIKQNGFVEMQNRFFVFKSICSSKFKEDPNELILKLGQLRNFNLIPKSAHFLEILSGKRKKSVDNPISDFSFMNLCDNMNNLFL